MRQYLLPKDGNFYKTNMHCHTTMSDGVLSPEEIKEIYMKEGYSVVAYTDHDLLIPENHLTDENFVALNGVELAMNIPDPEITRHKLLFHLCCIALEPDNLCTPYYHSSDYVWDGMAHRRPLAKPLPGVVEKEREYTAACFNDIVKEAKEHGFFVTYNHPDWSLEDQTTFGNYEGMDAMEIANFRCLTRGFLDYNPQTYDFFLRQGKRMYCVGGDDNHNNRGTEGTTKWDSFGAYTMIKAEKLEYRSITQALQDGNFYTSMGPKIHELWIEDGKLHIECSPAEKIIMTTARRRRDIVWAKEGETATEANFPIYPEDIYVRITVIDHRGRPADTNAYFL